MMPIMDGWSFRQAQLQNPVLTSIPVVVLSAAYDLRRQAAQIQAAAYLEKPFDSTKLISVVAYHYP
jgi:CheY-like chemotaxis protein